MRTCKRINTAIERLTSCLPNVNLKPTGGGRYELSFKDIPKFKGVIYRKHRALARITQYALDSGEITKEELREAVKWDLGLADLPPKQYRLKVDKMLDALGGSDTRMLLDVYGPE